MYVTMNTTTTATTVQTAGFFRGHVNATIFTQRSHQAPV